MIMELRILHHVRLTRMENEEALCSTTNERSEKELYRARAVMY